MKRVLITGAQGFIGRHIMQALNKKSFEIHCVTRELNPTPVDSDVIWHSADLLDKSECYELFSTVEPTYLLHLAWYMVPGKYSTSWRNVDWLNASLLLLRYFQKFSGERATFAGTVSEYDMRYGFCSENVTPAQPQTLYGICKDSLRRVAELACKQNGISLSWARIFFVYGQAEHPARLVSSVIRSLLQNEVAKVSHGNQVRDYLYSEDVASALVAIMEKDVTGIINVGSGKPITIRELVDKIAWKINKPHLIRYGAISSPKEEPPFVVADTRRLTSQIGWIPKHTLESGLDKTIAWWRERL